MGLPSEVARLTAEFLVDLHYRGNSSLRWQLQLQLLSPELLAELYRFLMDADHGFYRLTPGRLLCEVQSRYVPRPELLLLKACRLGMACLARSIFNSLETRPDDFFVDRCVFAAARGGHLDILLELTPDWDRPISAFSVLTGAAIGGQTEVFEYILRPLGRRDLSDMLAFAACKGHMALVQRMLELDVAVTPDALWLTAQGGRLEMLQFLMGRLESLGNGGWSLHGISSPEIVRLLVARFGATMPADQPTKLLWAAARQGNLELAELALELGADVSLNANDFCTFIGEGGSLELLARFPPPTARGWELLLQQAVTANRLEMVAQLLPQHAGILTMSAFREAVVRGHRPMLELLLTTPARELVDLNWLLIEAARYGHLEVVELLLEQGALPTIVAMEAALPSYPEIVQRLQSLD